MCSKSRAVSIAQHQSMLMQKHVCRDEEVSFGKTLAKGLERFKKAKAAASGTLLSGRDAFELYDTFGFPADLTQVQTLAHCGVCNHACRPLPIARAHMQILQELGTGVVKKRILVFAMIPLEWPCSRPPVRLAQVRQCQIFVECLAADGGGEWDERGHGGL